MSDLPRPPLKPHADECCGRGCCPCILDYYEDALERWRGRIRDRGLDPDAVSASFAAQESCVSERGS